MPAEVQRFDEIKKGDLVVARFFRALGIEVRKPTEAEKKASGEIALIAAKADPSNPPAATAIQAITAVVKIVAIDRSAQTVTVKGPQGNLLTVSAQDPKNLERIKVGETVVVSYTEAVAIALEKQAK